MRLQAASSLALVFLSLPVPGLYAQAPADPSDRFLSVFTAYQRGETFEGNRKSAEALTSFKEASQLLNSLATDFPTWNPTIVEYRRKRIAEAITRVQGKVASELPASIPSDGGGRGNPRSLPPMMDQTPSGGVFEPDLPPLPTDAKAPAPEPRGRNASRSTPADGDILSEIRERMAKAKEEVDRLSQERKQLQEEKDEALRKLKLSENKEQSAEQKMKILEDRSQRTEAELLRVKTKGAQDAEKIQVLQAESTKLKKEMRDLEDQRVAEQELREQTGNRLSVTRTNVRTLNAELEKERARAVTAEKKADAAIADATKRMEAAIKERDTLITKLTAVTQERDAALLQVGQMKEAQKNVDKLVADNTQLMAKLANAEKQITQVQADSKQKDVIIADLTKEVGAVKEQLSKVQKESASYQKQMSELQARLETTSTQLAKTKTDATATTAERKRMTEENELLRGVVLRQMKKQADRDQTRKLVLNEMAKMEIKSTDLLARIKYLGEPVVVLTPKERALFKKPQVEIGDNEIALAAPKQESPEEIAAPVPTEVAMNEPKAPLTSPTSLTPPLPTKGPEAPARSTAATKSSGNPAPQPPIVDRTASKPAPGAPTQELASLDVKNLTPPNASGDLPKSPAPTSTARSEPVGSHGVTETSTSPSTVPAELQPLAQEAKDQFDRGNYREAEKIYEKILTKAPANLYALSNLGVVRFREGKLKLAEDSFRKAVAIAPEDAFSRCTLGIIYYSQSRYDEAVTELTKSLAINPKYAAAHNFLGITASQKGWQEAAQKELETAISYDPNYADAHFNLAVVYATQQPPDKEKARLHYKRALELGADADPSLEGLLK